jgi:hypothetical protein
MMGSHDYDKDDCVSSPIALLGLVCCVVCLVWLIYVQLDSSNEKCSKPVSFCQGEEALSTVSDS